MAKYICDECMDGDWPCHFDDNDPRGERLEGMCPVSGDRTASWRKVDPADEPIPNAPSTVWTGTDGGPYFVHVECPGCKAKDEEIAELRRVVENHGTGAYMHQAIKEKQEEIEKWQRIAGARTDEISRLKRELVAERDKNSELEANASVDWEKCEGHITIAMLEQMADAIDHISDTLDGWGPE